MYINSSITFPPIRVIGIHCFCWIVYIGYEICVLLATGQPLATLQVFIAYYTVNIALFYTTAFTLDAIFTTKRWNMIGGILRYIIFVIIYLVIKLAISTWSEHASSIKKISDNFEILFSWLFRSWYFVMLGGFYWAAGHVTVYRLRLATMEAAFLRQRISPHLLFNSLNFIYSGVQECSDDAADAVLLLSGIMRSSLAEPGQDGKIQLNDELEQIDRLVQINRLRFSDRLNLIYIPGNSGKDFRIAPLVLVTLAENIFKHGNISSEHEPAQLIVSVSEEGQLHWKSSNQRNPEKELPGTGLGLVYVRERLEQYYRGKYQLQIRETESNYYTDLMLWL